MRIDVHNHAIPQRAIELLNAEPIFGATVRDGMWQGGTHVPFPLAPSFVDPDAKLAELEERGLKGAVVSVSPTLFYYHVDARAGEAMARAVNGGLEEFVAAWPDRMRWMASVPLQAPLLAVEVLEEASANGAAGVEIGTSAADHAARRAGAEPFWSAAERLALPVMLHPAYTTRTRAGGLLSRERDRVPARDHDRDRAADLRGDARPAPGPDARAACTRAATSPGRPAACATRARCGRSCPTPRATPASYVGQVLFDTITHDADALRFLVAKVGAENLVLGTDLPFDMATPDPLGALPEVCDEATVTRIAEDKLYFSRRRRHAQSDV